MFNEMDGDHDGVITRKQFLKILDIAAQQGARCNFTGVLTKADPSNYNAITFSKVIEVLSQTVIEDGSDKNLIDFIDYL